MAAFRLATAVVELQARVDRLERDLQHARGRVGMSMSMLQRDMRFMFSRAFRTVSRWAALVSGALGGIGVIATIKTAAATEELNAMFDEVFKSQSEEAARFAATLATNIGRSAIDMRQMMAGFQDVFVPMGMAREEATKMSKLLTTLTTDVAAFYNTGADETGDLLRSALVGNHRAARRFGIVITETRLELELLTMGIKGGIKEATNMQKLQARINIFMRDSADAMGQAAREAGTLTNRWRGLLGALKDLMEVAGRPFLQPLAQSLGPLIKNIREFTDNLQENANEMRLWIMAISQNLDRADEMLQRFMSVSVFALADLAGQLTAELVLRLPRLLKRFITSFVTAFVAALTVGIEQALLSSFLTVADKFATAFKKFIGRRTLSEDRFEEMLRDTENKPRFNPVTRSVIADFANFMIGNFGPLIERLRGQQQSLKEAEATAMERRGQLKQLRDWWQKLAEMNAQREMLQSRLDNRLTRGFISFQQANEEVQKAFLGQDDVDTKQLKELEAQTLLLQAAVQTMEKERSLGTLPGGYYFPGLAKKG